MTEETFRSKPKPGELERLFEMSVGLQAIAGFDGYFKLVSPAFERTLGHPLQDFLVSPWESFLHPDDIDSTRLGLSRVGTQEVFGHENRFRCANGSYRWMSWCARGFPEENLIFFVATDVTDTHEFVALLREREETFRVVFENAPIGMGLTTAEGVIERVNPAFANTLGISPGQIAGQRLAELASPQEVRTHEEQLEQLVRGEIPLFQMESTIARPDGSAVDALLRVGAVRDLEGSARLLVAQLLDISERKKAEERLQHVAVHDALTGLPNGIFFRTRLTEALARARRSKRADYAVLFVDLDRFKVINDSLGHCVGDELLVAIARRLRAAVRANDFVARLGGDEFTVLLDGVTSAAGCAHLADRIHASLQETLSLAGREVTTSASIGIAPGQTHYETADELLRDSDIAMYRAKAEGGGRHVFFDPGMHDRAMAVLQLEADLRQALQRNELDVYLQPIVSLATGRIEGFESLLRWRHPTRGLLAPSTFLQIAEDTGLIRPMGWWLMRACAQSLVALDRLPGGRRPWISVNLSNQQFLQKGLVEGISALLTQHALQPGRLRIEITETIAMHDPEQAAALLARLRATGITIDIDDFGTGYSSLAHLHRFPIDGLKIDRSFVSGMTAASAGKDIVGTIVRLAQSLGIDVIAEGVETAEQLARMRALGCTSAQGYFMSEPLPFAKALSLFEPDPVW